MVEERGGKRRGARFRRETELAARLRARWTVPGLAADADARAPRLVTADVAGPSLAQAGNTIQITS